MIDEKGRLFGKINIIDLLVILLVLVVAVVVGLKLMGKNQGIPGGGGGTMLTYTVRVSEVQPEVYEAIKTRVDAGDAQLMANGEMLSANITAVSATPYQKPVETMDGRIVYAQDTQRMTVVFTIEANITNPVTQAVGTQEVRIGKAHIVKTVDFELVNGVIFSCEQMPAA